MKPKKLLSFLLATAMAISLLPTFTLTASAATTTEKNITLGTSALSGYDSTNGYKYVYYGTYESNPIKWRVLDTAYNYDRADPSKTGMLVLSENALTQTKFGSDNSWNGSTAQTWCNNMYNSSFGTDEGTKEKDFILETISTDSILSNDYLFFLSYDEAYNSKYFPNDSNRIAFLNGDAVWWRLRSPLDDHYVYCVEVHGNIGFYYVFVYTGARPAFNLNLSSVLFTSAAENGKKTSNVGTLFENADNSGSEYKLTMKDDSREFAVTEDSITVPKGGSATFTYKNAKTGTNEYVSAMLLNENDEVLYYGQIKNVASLSEADGKATVEIPASVDTGTYTLKVFNEQINGDKKTDFSSAFQTVSLNVVKKRRQQAILHLQRQAI